MEDANRGSTLLRGGAFKNCVDQVRAEHLQVTSIKAFTLSTPLDAEMRLPKCPVTWVK